VLGESKQDLAPSSLELSTSIQSLASLRLDLST